MQFVSIKRLSRDTKVSLLQELGYDVDGEYIINQNGKRVKDKYTDLDVTLKDMAIFPGSTIIINDNPFSIASYFEEYGDAF